MQSCCSPLCFPIPFLRVLGNDKRLSATIGKESSVINNGVKFFLKGIVFKFIWMHTRYLWSENWKQDKHAKYSFRNYFNPYCIKYHENGIIKERNSKSFTFLHICWWKKKIRYATMQLLSDLLHAPNLMLMLTAKWCALK